MDEKEVKVITVNKRDSEWWEGMTVRSLLDAKKYSFKLIFVKINGKLVPRNEYDTYPIHDGDQVEAIHLMSGG